MKQNSRTDDSRRLDPEDPAFALPGPVLVLAGPGTGKTYRLAARIKFLIEQKNVDANQITAITFTGEAAANLRGNPGHFPYFRISRASRDKRGFQILDW